MIGIFPVFDELFGSSLTRYVELWGVQCNGPKGSGIVRGGAESFQAPPGNGVYVGVGVSGEERQRKRSARKAAAASSQNRSSSSVTRPAREGVCFLHGPVAASP
jgi:hypothetical protein